jgi:GTP-dependent dephospho-CoA kinase
MTIAYIVTPELRLKLKEPFGTLIQGSFSETMGKMETIVTREKPPKIVSVGDAVSKNLYKHNMKPQLLITDNKCMRKKVEPAVFEGATVVHVENPQGTITEESIAAIKEALESDEHTHIIVDGEEDLLALIAVLYAPEKSLVVYGQPYKGIVVVEVTTEKKAAAKKTLNDMKNSSKS